jgi:putative ABC transport system permease protein
MDFISQFFQDLKQQRLRTILTILGITWGTVAVVVLLSFGAGLATQMRKNAAGIGNGLVIMSGGRTTRAFAGFPEGRRLNLTDDDAELLRREVPEVELISPEFGSWDAQVRRGTQSANPYTTGIIPEYADFRNIVIEPGGRFINEQDVALRRRVAVLGDELDSLLFNKLPSVGEQVLLNGVPFTIIGRMQHKEQNSSYNARDKDRMFIPASTHKAMFGTVYVNNIVFKVRDPDLSKDAQLKIYQVLGRKYRFDPADEDALGIWDTTEQMKFFKYLFLGFNLFLGVIGGFTLAIGGIGVANIMYIVVRERTREIGIKRSVGATRRTIMFQFIAETFVVVGVGAFFGLLISVALVKLGGLLPIEEQVGVPTMSPMVMITTLALLSGIAFLAGLFPARRAAALDPIDCLRY